MSGLTIPHEVADAIALASLQEQREYLRLELKQWEDNPRTELNPNGYWLHPEDVVKNNILIRSMDEIIKYYGG